MTEPVSQPKPRLDWWLYLAGFLVLAQVGAMIGVHLRPGEWGIFLWELVRDLIPLAAAVVLVVGLTWSLLRRPFRRRGRFLGYATLAAVFLSPNLLGAYPSSHDRSPSQVPFRLPLDGPVTVAWGGPTEAVNYHVVAPDQRWAYDLVVTKNGEPNGGDGTKLTDFYYYGRPVLAPADGTVRRVDDGHADLPPGTMGGTPAGGNEVVIEVAPRQFLFLCHMQPHSIRVKPGQRVKAGDVIGRGGNSGNTSMPHLHIHLQDTADDDWGEGIPLEFHQYRVDGRVVDHGIPTGGTERPQVVEDVAEAAGSR